MQVLNRYVPLYMPFDVLLMTLGLAALVGPMGARSLGALPKRLQLACSRRPL